MSKYKEGDIVIATITGIEKYGAFAKLDSEYSGLIHISEITKEYVKEISDYLSIGDVINVKILNISNANNQLKLSAKSVGNKLNCKPRKKIKETVFGFYLLKSSLPNWIREKMAEINKKR